MVQTLLLCMHTDASAYCVLVSHAWEYALPSLQQMCPDQLAITAT